MATLGTIAAVATGAAAVIGAGASVYNGYLSYQSAQDQARQFEAKGREEFASAQRQALERRLEGQYVLSAQQAAAAASGGGAGTDDPTIVRLMTETATRAEYGAQSELFAGYSAKSLYDQSAENTRKTGVNNFIGSLLDGVGTLLGGAGQTYAMADKYGMFSTTTKQPTSFFAWGT